MKYIYILQSGGKVIYKVVKSVIVFFFFLFYVLNYKNMITHL